MRPHNHTVTVYVNTKYCFVNNKTVDFNLIKHNTGTLSHQYP